MSQYLSRFYCGNKEELCNFSEPIKYHKVLDRQFDNLLFDIIEKCPGDKGYCCEKTKKNMEDINKSDLDKINNMTKAEIYKRNENGNYYKGQIPLIKTNKKNGKLESIDVCQCGGNLDSYNNCVKKNCKDYKIPSKYEFCKLGNSERFGCYGKEGTNCKVGEENKKNAFMYSHNMKIKDLFPDCYLNACNKRHIDGSLDLTSNYTTERDYYGYENNIESDFESIKDYLLIPSESKTKSDSKLEKKKYKIIS